jgi:hypothetical protein
MRARGAACFGLQTDSRRFGGTDSNNLMIDYSLTGGIARSIDELTAVLGAHLAALSPPTDPPGHG